MPNRVRGNKLAGLALMVAGVGVAAAGLFAPRNPNVGNYAPAFPTLKMASGSPAGSLDRDPSLGAAVPFSA
jgi:hypothetical protein